MISKYVIKEHEGLWYVREVTVKKRGIPFTTKQNAEDFVSIADKIINAEPEVVSALAMFFKIAGGYQ